MTGKDLYRTRDFVPDFDAISAEYTDRSRRLAETAPMRADIAYGARPRETLDLLFPPKTAAGAPLHVFVHGGYWRHGDKANYRFVAAPALAAGAVAAIVEYDLMPGQRLPVLVDQVRRAVSWLQRHATEFDADPARLTVSGHSAGAHLVSYLAATGRGDVATPALPPLAGMMLVSGIYDLSGIPDSFLRHEAQMTPAEAADWSPLTSGHLACPHRILAFGAGETAPFRDQATALHGMLAAGGHSADLISVPDQNHMSLLLDLASVDGQLGRKLVEMVVAS
jgi:arylformamidase